ncbi:MAG TPA: FeoA family protein [Anaerolineales bacterium]|nr:FeoA family protein [Anaerolineales bacterium]
MMNLMDVPVGQSARLTSVAALLQVKLRKHGLHVGDRVRVLRQAPLGGPLLVEANGREVALGRGVAKKIFVEVECASH